MDFVRRHYSHMVVPVIEETVPATERLLAPREPRREVCTANPAILIVFAATGEGGDFPHAKRRNTLPDKQPSLVRWREGTTPLTTGVWFLPPK